MHTHLSGSHRKTFEHIFQHPISHNLQWREVAAMFNAMEDVDVVEDDNGHLKITRNSESITLHRPRGKDLADIEELVKIRHFLEQTGVSSAPPAVGANLLVVIDHREARIYSTELHGATPHKITPYDPHGFGRALHYNQAEGDGHLKPERKSFYEAVAKTLRGAQQIVMFGNGTGASSAMEHLLHDLKQHHHDVAARIISTTSVNEHHMTEDQLLAKARELFAATDPAQIGK